MKKGKKGNSIRHKFSTIWHSGVIIYAGIFIAAAIISLGTFIMNIVIITKYTPTDQSELSKCWGDVVISILSLAASLIGAVRSLVIMIRNIFHRQFIESPGYKEHIQKTVGENLDSQYEKSHYSWKVYNNERYLCSKEIDNALSKAFPPSPKKHSEFDILLKISSKKQKFSSNQSESLYQIVKQKRASGKNIFNSNLVRLRTDLFIDDVLSDKNLQSLKDLQCNYIENERNKLKLSDIKFINLEKTDYYSNITSNDMIYSRLFQYDHSSIYYGKDMTVYGDTLYNLSQSPAANIIGVSTLAITSDGKLIINKQNNNNDVNNDYYVPSGSGSADFDDLKNCRKLEKKTYSQTSADKLDYLCKSYKTIKIKNLKNAYKKVIGQQINSYESNDKILIKYDSDRSELTKAKKAYETGIESKKEYNRIKQYCKKLNKYTCSFKNFITYGMVRELVEESHVCDSVKHKMDPIAIKNLMDGTEICGYIRILDRGGKPDFFGITYLDYTEQEMKEKFYRIGLKISKKELQKQSKLTDYSEICSQYYISQDKLLNCENFEDLFPVTIDEKTGEIKKAKLSLQLFYLLTIMKNKLKDNYEGSTDN